MKKKSSGIKSWKAIFAVPFAVIFKVVAVSNMLRIFGIRGEILSG